MMKAWLLDEMFRFHRAALTVEGSQGEWGAGDSIAEEEELPPAPANVAAKCGNGRITITWDPVPDAMYYNLYFQTTKGVQIKFSESDAAHRGSGRLQNRHRGEKGKSHLSGGGTVSICPRRSRQRQLLSLRRDGRHAERRKSGIAGSDGDPFALSAGGLYRPRRCGRRRIQFAHRNHPRQRRQYLRRRHGQSFDSEIRQDRKICGAVGWRAVLPGRQLLLSARIGGRARTTCLRRRQREQSSAEIRSRRQRHAGVGKVRICLARRRHGQVRCALGRRDGSGRQSLRFRYEQCPHSKIQIGRDGLS